MTRADWLLLTVIAVILPLLYAGLWRGHGPGAAATIRAPETAPRTVALDRDQTLQVRGRMGPSTIEIKDGRARFVRSACTRKVCIHAGWLKEAGELAACLPNGVSLEIIGGDRHYDAINF